MANNDVPEGLRHEQPEGYSRTPQWVIKAARKDVWLYDWLRARYGGMEETFPGIETLAKEFEVSRSTIERTLRALQKAGVLEIRRRFKEADGTIVVVSGDETYSGTGAQTTNEYVTKFFPPAKA